MASLNDPAGRREYASERGLLGRRAAYKYAEGPDAPEMVFEAVAEARPRSVLDVGCGPGELAERVGRELGAKVRAIDISPRMVELARERGVDARVADVERIPFGSESFDCVVAAWMLYHVPAVDRALSEMARVLKAGGRLVAKPIVDVQVSVADVGDDASYVPALVAAGYELRVGERGHRMLRTPERDVHVHVCDADGDWERRHLAFRDRLRSSPADRDRYAAVSAPWRHRDGRR